jgi:dTDP-4-dehydrorhamnose 3,5-epimerase-like enzyme
LWNDPSIGIEWRELDAERTLSKKDQTAQTLADWLNRPESDFFTYA